MSKRSVRILWTALLWAAIGGSFAPVAWAQDVDPPVIDLTESGAPLADGALFNRTVTPVITVTDASPVTVDTTLDGVPYTSGDPVSGEGQYQLAVSATDDVGNSATQTLLFTIDLTPPVFGTVSPAEGILTSATEVTLTGQVTGATALTVDGATIPLVGESFTAGPYPLTDGDRSWTLVAADDAGNTATLTRAIVRDGTPPAVSFSQPAAGSLHTVPTVDVFGTASDPRLTTITVNGIAASRSGTTFVATGVPLAEGETVLTAVATDAAGNVGQATRAVTLDTTPPEVTVTDPAPGTVTPEGSYPVRATATDAHLDRVEIDGVAATLSGGVYQRTVPLSEGVNDIPITARDLLGLSTTVTATVLRDSAAPVITLTTPAEGLYTPAATVDVTGTVVEEPGLTVTVNGTAATLTGADFSLAGVALVEGENRLIARATDAQGNQGVHTRLVYRDTVAPEFLSSDPPEGALAIDPGSVFVLTLSEPPGPVVASAWRLRTAGGQLLPATLTTEGSQLTVTPDAPLPPDTGIEVVLTGDLTDRAGNRLAVARTLAFSTADTAAPGAPTVAAVPGALCAPTVTLSGSTESEATVAVTGGSAVASVRAAVDGTFTVTVELLPTTLNRLEIVATDPSRNPSPAAVVEVVHDCQPPQVVSARTEGDAVVVRFSEVIDGPTVPGTVGVETAGGPIPGAAVATPDGREGRFTPDTPPLPVEPMTVTVTTGVRDLAGNALAYPFRALLGGEVTPSFLAGRVLDCATGRPLPGADAEVLSTDGVAHTTPVPQQLTGEDGRFQIPVQAGSHFLLISRLGYTPVLRLVASGAGAGADVFDPRLTPAGDPQTVGTAGGSYTADALTLDIPAAALAADTAVAVTALEEQGLPALLPFGWSPRGAAWVDLSGASLTSEATLTLPVDAAEGTLLTLVRLDLATLQWIVVTVDAPVSGGAVTVPVAAEGGFGALEGDLGTTAPPLPTAGLPLGAAPAPSGTEVLAATVTFDPATVLPAQRSVATLDYTLNGEAPSGLPLTIEVREELTLLDGTVRRGAPFAADILLFHASGGGARSIYGLQPSAEAGSVALEVGLDTLTVRPYAGETVQGNVLGPLGGAVATPEGDRVDIPGGALPEPTAVILTRGGAADLPVALPSEATFLGLLTLDLGGQELAVNAALTLELGAAPGVGEEGLLLEAVTVGTVPTGDRYRVAAQLTATASGWTTATVDDLDLPWPGVRRGGRYVFVRLEAPVGFLRGTVHGIDSAVAAGAVVSATATPSGPEDPEGWVQLSRSDGRYALPVLPDAVTAVVATALNPLTRNFGQGSSLVAAAGERVDLDLQIQISGPTVVEVNPIDGALDITPGVEPTVRFSELVNSSTLPGSVRLLKEGAVVEVDLEQQGDLVRLIPRATLTPGTEYEVRVSTNVRDLQGNRLATPFTSTFTTLEVTTNSQLDLTRIHLLEPDAQGQAQVLGRSGAVPDGTLVFVENQSRLTETVSLTVGQDGSFAIDFEAEVGDTVLLHILITGQNEIILELSPFQSRDGKSAHILPEAAAAFTTFEGITLAFEAGAFDRATVVSAEVRSLADFRAPTPTFLSTLFVFDLDYGGATLLKKPVIELPIPTGAVGDEFLLSRAWRILGEEKWMLHDLLRRDGALLTNQALPETQALLPPGVRAEGQLAASRWTILPGAADLAGATLGQIQALPTPATQGDRQRYLPSVVNPGRYLVMESTTALDFVAVPFIGTNLYFEQIALEGMVAVINSAIARLLEFDAVLLPTLSGEPYSLVGRDLSSGFEIFSRDFSPAPPGGIDILPPTAFGDLEELMPVGGSPLRLAYLDPAEVKSELVFPGVRVVFDDPAQPGATVQITGDPGALDPGVGVRLHRLGGSDTQAVAGTDGAVQLSSTYQAGDRFLLVLGATVMPDEPLYLLFSEALKDPAPDAVAVTTTGSATPVALETTVQNTLLEIRAPFGWQAGTAHTVHLASTLADIAGNPWNEQLELDFLVAGSEVLGVYGELAAVRDVARLGSLLFVAADTQGLAVLDASDPGAIVNFLPTGLTFPFPAGDPVRAVDIDPHGRVVVVGGGVATPGQLKIFDPLALDLAALAADPTNPAVLYAAFRGNTQLSDKLGGTGTSRPEGQPRQVAVLSVDDKDRWRVGETPPAGITLAPQPSPTSGEFTLTVSGESGLATAGLPVTLRNLTRGRWQRVDGTADGSFAVSLAVYPGDEVELLRNRQSLAYTSSLGLGISVVDVNAVYLSADLDEPADQSPVTSAVLGDYSGAGDDALTLCNEPVTDLGTALIDLGTLYDGNDPHPLVVAGLISFRGLALIESEVNDVGQMSFLKDICAQVAGSARVQGLALVEDYPLDLDGDGQVVAAEIRDYALVTHLTGGLLIFDLTERDAPSLVSRIRLPGQPAHLGVDRRARRIFISGPSGSVYVVDFEGRFSTALVDGNQDGLDDRILETLTIPNAGATNAPVFLLPELGIALAGGSGQGLTSLAVGPPQLRAVANGSEVAALAPFGVPADPAGVLPGSFRIHAFLPATVGPTVKVDVVSLGPGGAPIFGLGDPAFHPDLPPTALTGTEGVTLHRQAVNPWEEGFGVYLSDEVAVLADARAARGYSPTAAEQALCPRCLQGNLGVAPDARELLGGETVAIRFPAALRATLAALYTPADFAHGEVELASVRWETSPAVRQEPTQNPSFGHGEAAPGTLLHSGEMTQSATDLAVRGRGIDFAFTRTYRSQTVGAGPLGPGWDFGYRARLRALPDGAVEFFDGRGRRELFTRAEDGTFTPPPGRFAELTANADGWVLIDARRNQLRFDRFGRLSQLSDAVKRSADTGNALRFFYDLQSQLVAIRDTLDREIRLEYDGSGRLTRLADFDGRDVLYQYDSEGRLRQVESPAVTTGTFSTADTVATQTARLATVYGYGTPVGNFPQRLATRDNLATLTDPKGQPWLTLTYTDADGDSRADEVTAQQWGTGTVNLAYDFGTGTTTVTDRRGNASLCTHNASGQALSFQDPTGATWATAYNPDGLPTLVTEPLGRVTTLTYNHLIPCDGGVPLDAARGRGNVTKIVVTADGRGENGSTGPLESCIDYDGPTNQPIRMKDPRGILSRIGRDFSGLPRIITSAEGTPEETTETLAYNVHGQLTDHTNPNGHQTRFTYYTTGPGRGYPRQTIVDPAGLALTTTALVDARGNVTFVIDPRGVRSTFQYNALDWLEESHQAVTGTTDGSNQPSLGYVWSTLYDANGNVLEESLPFGDGSQVTRIRTEYGALDEALATYAQVMPGDSFAAWVGESVTYDANLNPIQTTGAEGQVTTFTYDPRNLLSQTTQGVGTPEAVTQTFAYNLEGQRLSVLDGRGNPWSQVYDGYGRPMKSLDPLGHYQTVAYDNGGNAIEQTAVDAAGKVLAHSTVTYDALNRPTMVTEDLWEYSESEAGIPAAAAQRVSQTFYDAASNVVKTRDALGRETTFEYDAAERQIAQQDPLGNRTELTLDAASNVTTARTVEQLPAELGLPAVTVDTFADYDALNRPIAQRDALGNTTKTLYDARGLVLESRDARDFATTQLHDGLNRLTATHQPEGISLFYGYDKSSRRISYTDALGNQTTWAYDALDRVTTQVYPDGATHHTTHDAAHNVAQTTDPNGTVVTNSYDPANRLTGRTITPAAGVEGPTTESYAYDGLHRLTQATSGSIVTAREYDSLSRLKGETNLGRTVGYGYDLVDNVTQVVYPSGQVITRAQDALNRLSQVSLPLIGGGNDLAATYAYRGPWLTGLKQLGNGVGTSRQYDASRRLQSQIATLPSLTVTNPADGSTGTRAPQLYSEVSTHTQRNERSGIGRGPYEGAERANAFAYDGAGRLRLAAMGLPTDAVENNTSKTQSELQALANGLSYLYDIDAAQNLTERKVEDRVLGVLDAMVAMPDNGTGRNQPGSVGSSLLEWDASGNLTRKGDLRFHYDYRHRLTRVTSIPDGELEIAAYAYDAFNRRVQKTTGPTVTEMAWDGWREVEDYQGGGLAHRWTYGNNLDEVVRFDANLDLDPGGSLEESYYPLYDAIGNLVQMTGSGGEKLAEYRYSPFGEDLAAWSDGESPAPTQVLIRNGSVYVEFSEEVSLKALLEGILHGGVLMEEVPEGGGPAPLTVGNITGRATVDISASMPIEDGEQARQRLVLTPAVVPAAGQELELVLVPEAVEDTFLNRPATELRFPITWPADATATTVVDDTVPPEVVTILLRDGFLEVEFTEEPDLTAATAVLSVDTTAITWEAIADYPYTLRSSTPLAAGTHTVTVGTGPLDLAGLGLVAPVQETLTYDGTTPVVSAYRWEDPNKTVPADLLTRFAYHGRPRDQETGLIYIRNRYYDPELGRFLTGDPLGYGDGPNLYQWAGNNPTTFTDPLGLYYGISNGEDSPTRVGRDQRAAARNRGALQQLQAQLDVQRLVSMVDPYGDSPDHARYGIQNYLLANGHSQEGAVDLANLYMGSNPGTCGDFATQVACNATSPFVEPAMLLYATGIDLLMGGTMGAEMAAMRAVGKSLSYADELAKTRRVVWWSSRRGPLHKGGNFSRRGLTKGFQDHHIISDKNRLTKNHKLISLSGFNLQSRANKMFLPTKASLHPTRSIHLGGHRLAVSRNLAKMMDAVVRLGQQRGWDTYKYKRALSAIISEERQLLRSGHRALNRLKRPWAE